MITEYITKDGVKCKNCGILIVSVENGVGYPTPMYTEVEIKFSDGSNHITPMCKGCAIDPTLDLQAIYGIDVGQWKKELKGTGRKLDATTERRIPVSCGKPKPIEPPIPQRGRGRNR